MRLHIRTKEQRSFAANAVSNITQADNVDVIIEPHVDEKSNEQQAFFHVLCRHIATATGYTEGEVKQLVKSKVLGTRTVKIGGVEAEVICSSEVDETGKPRSKPSYSELIEGAYQLGAEAGISLPNPMKRAG